MEIPFSCVSLTFLRPEVFLPFGLELYLWKVEHPFDGTSPDAARLVNHPADNMAKKGQKLSLAEFHQAHGSPLVDRLPTGPSGHR